MNIKRKLLIGIMAISLLPISAQEQRVKEPEKISFKPHWFIQAQIGAAHTVGEAKFTDLISPAAALNVGYKFAPAFGARVGVSGWQAKGGWVNPQQTYQYKYPKNVFRYRRLLRKTTKILTIFTAIQIF